MKLHKLLFSAQVFAGELSAGIESRVTIQLSNNYSILKQPRRKNVIQLEAHARSVEDMPKVLLHTAVEKMWTIRKSVLSLNSE